jgi:hypothetical protein
MTNDQASETTCYCPSDFTRIVVLLLLAAGLRAFTVANVTVPSRDCIVFIRDGLQLENPDPELFEDRLAVIRGVEHPPGYPAAIIAMSWIVRPLMGTSEPTPESMALSAQLVSAVAAVLLVFPLFFIARRIFDRNTAFAAVAIVQVLPVFVEVTSDGISDGLFLLTVVTALWFALRAIDSQRVRTAFLFGLGAGAFCGLGYLIRPDALIVALAIGLTFAGMVISGLRRRQVVRPFVAGLGLVIATFGVMSPYCITIGGLTNKPTGGGLIKSIQGEETQKTFHHRPGAKKGGVDLPLAAWWNPEAHKGQTKSVWAAKALGSEFLKTSHYVLPFFAVPGLVHLVRRWREARVALLLVMLVVHLSILWFMAWKFDYVSQRHVLLPVIIETMIAASFFPILGAHIIRKWSVAQRRNWTPWQVGAACALLVMAIAIPRDFRSLHRDRIGHKVVGKWLAENGDPTITVADPFGWAEWYAGRTMRTWPALIYTADRDFYLVHEPNSKSPHSRLNHYAFVRELSQKSEMIYQYPPDAPPDRIKVAVYRYRHPPAKK